jgi:hypothetical protein
VNTSRLRRSPSREHEPAATIPEIAFTVLAAMVAAVVLVWVTDRCL